MLKNLKLIQEILNEKNQKNLFHQKIRRFCMGFNVNDNRNNDFKR